MPQSLSSILVHLIFSTKNREPFITPAIESELHPYLAKVLRELKSPSLALNGTSDHIHVLFALGRVITVAELTYQASSIEGQTFRTFEVYITISLLYLLLVSVVTYGLLLVPGARDDVAQRMSDA